MPSSISNISPLKYLLSPLSSPLVLSSALMIFCAFLTPGGDFLSLPLTTCILYGLYELSILAAIRIERKRGRVDEDSVAEEDDWMQD